MWHDVVHLLCGCGGGYLGLFLARNTHKELAREISHETRRRRRKEGLRDSRQERSVKRREQSAEGSRRDQSTEQVSQEMRVGQRGGQSTEVRKAAARTCWPKDVGWPTPEVMSALLVALWEFSLEYTHALAHRMHKKCYRYPLYCACSWPKSVFVRLFFSSTLSVVLCVFVKKCEIPLTRNEKNHKLNHWPWVV